MSSNVTIITSDAKRAVVKATPGTYLTDLLQQACQKLNLNSDSYQLKHGKKIVDLSVPFRLSGLSPGAKLDLVFKSKTASIISLVLQLPGGERIPSQFPSNFSIWQILRQYESGKAGEGRNLQITQRGYPVLSQGGGNGLLLHEMPVVTIVQRELRELEDFKKTLSQLGFNTGPILLKLSFRKTNTPLIEAMEQVQAMFADQEGTLAADISKPAPAHSKPVTQVEQKSSSPDQPQQKQPEQGHQPSFSSVSEQPTSPPTMQRQASEPSTSSAAGASHLKPESTDLISFDNVPSDGGANPSTTNPLTPTHIYAAPSSNVPQAARLKFNESNYIPTLEHAAMHQHRLQEGGLNKRLPSDSELEARAAAKNAKLNQVKSIEIRVRFPDNTSVDWTVGPEETGARFYEAVRSVMADPAMGFHLALPPNQRIRDEVTGTSKDFLIKGYELKGNVLLNLVLEDSGTPGFTRRRQPFLKPEFAKKAEQVAVVLEPEAKDEPEKENSFGGRLKNLGTSVSKEAESAAKKVPKWFKMGKK